jgi:hypothetical protein
MSISISFITKLIFYSIESDIFDEGICHEVSVVVVASLIISGQFFRKLSRWQRISVKANGPAIKGVCVAE